MALSAQSRAVWEQAQTAEQGHWAWLWLPDGNSLRQQVVDAEIVKGEYIFQHMTDHFGVRPKQDWSTKRLLDVGCGPVSLVARNEYGKTRAGVDPLPYPSWVYEEYAKHDFRVYKQPFEELSSKQKYDVIIFYNALQHFADLELVAKQCKALLSKSGAVFLSEYLEVPTDSAHIQYLQAPLLDLLFKSAGLNVDAIVKSVRLPGFVERGGGLPIELYVAKLSHGV